MYTLFNNIVSDTISSVVVCMDFLGTYGKPGFVLKTWCDSETLTFPDLCNGVHFVVDIGFWQHHERIRS